MRDSDSPTFYTAAAASEAQSSPAALLPPQTAMATAEALTRLGARRDPLAWAVLIERHGPAILRVAQRATHDPVLCEDICQETLLQIREHAGRFRALGSPHESELFARGWIMRIACRTALKMIRSRTRGNARDARAEPAIAVAACPAQSALHTEEREQVRREVAALPEPHRDAISLRFFADLAYADIAESLQITEEAAKKRVQRGIDLLRSRLAVSGIAMSATLLSGVLQSGAGQAAETAATAASDSVSGAGSAATEILLDEHRRAAWQALVNTGQAPALSGVVTGAAVTGGLTMMGKVGVGVGVAATLIAALGVGGGMEIRASRQLASDALGAAKESAAHAKALETKINDGRLEVDSLRRLMETRNSELTSLRDKVATLEKTTKENSSATARMAVPAPNGHRFANLPADFQIVQGDPNEVIAGEVIAGVLPQIEEIVKQDGQKTTTQRFTVGDGNVMVMTQVENLEPFEIPLPPPAAGETPEETLKRLKAHQEATRTARKAIDELHMKVQAPRIQLKQPGPNPQKPEEKAGGEF